MKRFFRNLKTLAMVAMVGVASLAVSCSQPYDDTQIKADIADLQTRVEALEVGLKNQLQTVKDLIDAEVAELNGAIGDAMDAIEAVEAKIAILDYEQNADGSWTLTTKGGEEIVVYPQYQENNDGLLTVVQEGNTYYWAQIVNGQPVVLVDADGNKYAAHHATVVPEVEFPECEYVEPQVVKEDEGGYKVSFDGGKTWYPLGGGNVTVEASCLFEDVYISEDGKTLSLTINGGQTFTTTLPEEFAFSVKSGKQFFTAGESKEVSLELQAVQDCEVIAKPEGWKASVNGKKLTIVAPAEGGDESGVIKVLAITNDNRAAFGKLNVATGAGYSISVETVDDPIDGLVKQVVVRNASHYQLELEYEGTFELFTSLRYGVVPASEFSPEAIVEGVTNWTFPYMTYDTDMYGPNYYDPEMPEMKLTHLFDYFWCDADWEEPIGFVTGEEYVFWVMPYDMNYNTGQRTYRPEDIVYVEYCEKFVDVKVTSTTAFDIQLDVKVAGYDGYYVLGNEASRMMYWDEDDFPYWQKGYHELPYYEENFSGSIFELMDPEYGQAGSGTPGSEYWLVIIPAIEGKSPAEYTVEDCIVINDGSLKTKDIETGGAITPTITVNTDGITFEAIPVTINAEGASVVYYDYIRIARWENPNFDKTPDGLAAYLVSDGYITTNLPQSYNGSGFEQGETVRFAAFALDADGKRGDITIVEATTKVFALDENIKVEVGTVTSEGKYIVVPVSAPGVDVAYYEYATADMEMGPGYWNNTLGGTPEKIGTTLAITGNGYKVTLDKLVDGCLNIEAGFSTYNIAVIAVDKSGNAGPATLIENYRHDMPGEILLVGDEGYEVGKPNVTLRYTVINEKYDEYEIWADVEPQDGATVIISKMDEDYEATYSTPWALVKYFVTSIKPVGSSWQLYGYSAEAKENTSVCLFGSIDGDERTTVWDTTCLYYTWYTVEDGVNIYREPVKINLYDYVKGVE